jgi:hypothetical protein
MFKTRSGLDVIVESKNSVSVTLYIVKNGEKVGYNCDHVVDSMTNLLSYKD